MPKVSPDDLKAFGLAVKRARTLRTWTLDQLGAALDPPVGKSFVSKVEKGQKDALSARTVGRFIKALALDEDWIDRFLDADETGEDSETQTEREADRLMQAIAQDETIPQGSEDLLILLANQHAKGDYTDRITAFVGLREALRAAERIRQRGEMPVGNADQQLNATMKEVAKLNAVGEVDAADALLNAEEKRMLATHKAEQDRMEQQAQVLLERRLDQDRLRDDPAAAADRLIRDLLRRAPAGGVVRATGDMVHEWRQSGKRQGDPFDLRVALVLANRNLKRAKRPQRHHALNALGLCRLAIGERQRGTRLLNSAEQACRSALTLAQKNNDRHNRFAALFNLANTLTYIGQRTHDAAIIREAIALHRKALAAISLDDEPEDWASSKSAMGSALHALGKLERDPARLADAMHAYAAALTIRSLENTPEDWAGTQLNIAICSRSLIQLSGDGTLFDSARDAYENALIVWKPDTAPYDWANTIGGLGELALERFDFDPDPAHLDEAETNLRDAKSVMSKSNEVLDERIDDLLARIEAARTGLPRNRSTLTR